MLTDIVSKNGNLLINIVQTPEGDLEPDMLTTLEEIGDWIAIHGEGIYGTRPWKIYGEGPSTQKTQAGQFGGLKDVPDAGYTSEDFRFTASKDGKTMYVFCMGKPTATLRIVSLGSDAEHAPAEIEKLSLLGQDKPLQWTQQADALVIEIPDHETLSPAAGIKIEFKN